MKVVVVGFAATLVGCYGPTIQPGLPCDPALDNCPHGQACRPEGAGHVCGGSGSGLDAAPDGPLDDLDGDGVRDPDDNCPERANPTQHDEDLDRVGDACDPCPVSSNNLDTDGDGVGDECDPSPMTAGDAIVAFEGLEMSPPGWIPGGGGTWSHQDDELHVSVAGEETAVLVSSFEVGPRTSVMASLAIEATAGSPSHAGIANPFTLDGMGVLCSVGADDQGDRIGGLYDLTTDVVLHQTPLSWVEGTRYLMLLERGDTQFGCIGFDPETRDGASGDGTAMPPSGSHHVALVIQSATVRYQWVLVLSHP